MYVDSNHTKGGKVPSTNKLSSRTSRSVAKFLLSFCGLASFGVVTTLIALSTNNVYAESNSNTITANLPGSVAIRLLDSTGTTEISSLDFNNLTPTPQGTTASKSFIVDVATSNPTGYKLYMQSDYKIDDGDNDSSNDIYTTNLTHTDSDVTDVIPTSTTSGSKVYWNYVNPLTNSGSSNPTPSVIPPYGTPDKIAQYFSPTNSHQSTVDINVGIDTTIVSGTYENELLFSVVGNPNPVSYNIDFDADGGTPEPADISTTAAASTYSTTIPTTAPVKTGYTFSHWEITSVSNGPGSNSDIEPTATCNDTNICHPGDTLVLSSFGESGVSVELTAIYTINSHTVTINNGTGISNTTITCSNNDNSDNNDNNDSNSSNGSNTCTYGDTVSISATPATGYTFDSNTGWTVVSGGVTIVNSQFTMPDNSVTITANAIKMFTYTLNLNTNDGTSSKQVLNYPASGGTADTSHTFTNLNSQAPTRSGYAFKGWSTTSTGTTPLNPDSYTLNSSSASTTPTSAGFPVTGNLYAIWEVTERTIANSTYFQEVTSCPSTLVEGTQYSLKDQGEPSKSYNAARLKDGKCWMTSDYNLSSAAGTLSSTYYNVPSSSTFALRASSTSWGSSATGNYVYNRTGTNGGLYSWYAATAGTNPSSGTSSYDICPKGWRLPTQAEYQTIINNYGSTGAALVASNAKLQYSGYCYSSYCPYLVGSYGYYWSSTANSSSQAYALFFYSSNARMYNGSKYGGFSVRCVFGS